MSKLIKGKLNPVNKTILIISLVGAVLYLYVVIRHLVSSCDYSPRIFGIPCCYILFGSYLFCALSMKIRDRSLNRALFFVFAFIGLILSVWFSISSLAGWVLFPVIVFIPLCYIDFVFFVLVLILKMIRLN